LGGTSVINFMLYVRGNKRDYDEWAALGNEGWSYENVLPFFIKSEDNHGNYLDGKLRFIRTIIFPDVNHFFPNRKLPWKGWLLVG
jgi:choline dehydrogenase-like flavoprotein